MRAEKHSYTHRHTSHPVVGLSGRMPGALVAAWGKGQASTCETGLPSYLVLSSPRLLPLLFATQLHPKVQRASK